MGKSEMVEFSRRAEDGGPVVQSDESPRQIWSEANLDLDPCTINPWCVALSLSLLI